ncbi:MAG: HAMP domain-containing histidine kinase [Planctomycetes bacterium]|nr:HAMP domain-containing histidine kinase [Planctomycetota bacterium]
MLFVHRLRELFSTLRFQLVLWITLAVFVMVVATNLAVRAFEQQALRLSYDQFLRDSLEEVNVVIAEKGVADLASLDAPLKKKVRDNAYRTWFLQIYDGNRRAVWTSENAPSLDAPSFTSDSHGPYDERHATHRVFERRFTNAHGERYFIRCGFLQVALQDDLDLLNRNLLLVSISLLLAAPLGAYFIALRAMQPITQIIETTAHLQPGNLNERLPIRGTGDEIDQLSMTINGMLDRLASFIEQNRDFVANAAHELRSPLAAIRTSVEVALNRSRTPEEYAAILADVMEEIGRLVGLVNRLLILAEGDAGRLAGADQLAPLDKIVRQSIDMFEAVAESQGVRLILGDVTSATVRGDEAYLRQVISNLIDNAIKYNRSPGEVVVQLRADPVRKQAILTVKDTGIGIDRDVLPRVFERFYRADKARSREKEHAGYGLGLSICQTIIQSLHGEISVESEIGRGTTFTVRLPLAEPTRTVEAGKTGVAT